MPTGAPSTARGRLPTSTLRPRTATSPLTLTRPSAISCLARPTTAVADPGEHLLEPLAFGLAHSPGSERKHLLEHLDGRRRRNERRQRWAGPRSSRDRVARGTSTSSRTRSAVPGRRHARPPARSHGRRASASRSRRSPPGWRRPAIGRSAACRRRRRASRAPPATASAGRRPARNAPRRPRSARCSGSGSRRRPLPARSRALGLVRAGELHAELFHRLDRQLEQLSQQARRHGFGGDGQHRLDGGGLHSAPGAQLRLLGAHPR